MLLRPATASARTVVRVFSHCRARRLYAASAVQEEPSQNTHSESTTTTKKKTARKPRKSKSKAEHPPEPSPWTRNLLEGTKVEEYLSALSGQQVLSLEDIERHRPSRHSSSDTPQYEDEYTKLVATLCQSFSAQQLRSFCVIYNLDRKYTRHQVKPNHAIAIIEQQWKWPALADVRKHRALWSTYSARKFVMTALETFLIMGHEGSQLLSLAGRHKVHISLLANPLRLRVEGVEGALEAVDLEIQKMKSDVIHEMYDVPGMKVPLPNDTLQRLSRLSNCYIQNTEKSGKVRISAKDPKAIRTAKRFIVRTVLQTSEPPSPLLTFSPVATDEVSAKRLFPLSYSLYPFTPARPLPWTAGSSRVFRARRVGEWLGIDTIEDILLTGGLSAGQGAITQLTGDQCELLGFLTEGNSSYGQIKATFGHVLIPTTPAQRASIAPPLQGNWPMSKITQFIRTHPIAPIFVPSLPTALLQSDAQGQAVLHSLEYRTFPTPRPQEEEQKRKAASKAAIALQPRPVQYLKWQVGLPSDRESDPHKDLEPETEGGVAQGDPDSSSSAETSSTAKDAFLHECRVGQEVTTMVMLPDRPLDLQLSAFSEDFVEQDDYPLQLKEYFRDLHTFLTRDTTELGQPEPPLSFHYRGQEYFLYLNQSIKHHTDMITSKLDRLNEKKVSVSRQSVLDLESMRKSALCQLTCNGQEEQTWRDFLSDCDHLTCTPNLRVSNTELL